MNEKRMVAYFRIRGGEWKALEVLDFDEAKRFAAFVTHLTHEVVQVARAPEDTPWPR